MEATLNPKAAQYLKDKKNLLAFSAGTDSSALFFMLLEKNISFDIAIVNYKLRSQSHLEVEYAKELAKTYDKKIFIKEAPLSPPSIELKARKIRYDFFEQVIKQYNYQNLITAHHLNDQLEWFLMQFTKGAGLVELLGMGLIDEKKDYCIVRPLLFTAKKDIKKYLKQKKIKYFEDITNKDIKFKRNFFRKEFSDKLMELFDEGIKRSFEYLHLDKQLFLEEFKVCNLKELFIIKNQKNDLKNIRAIDKAVKSLGYLLSSKQKREILKQKKCVIGKNIAIDIDDDYIFVSPYIKIVMDKKFKESCRILKIPEHVRGYIFKSGIEPKKIKNCIEML